MADAPGSSQAERAEPAAAGRTAAFFDLDKTIIATSSATAFGRPFRAGGLISRGAMLRTAYAQFVFVLGGADHDQVERLRQFMSKLVAGWDVATVQAIVADTLHNIIDPTVYDEAVNLIAEHRTAGRDVIIVSTSGSEVVGPIGAMLGADRVIATKLEIKDGRYTGEIDRYMYAAEKAHAIVALAETEGYDLAASFAYSDSITDVPMLEAVGHPHAVNPDKELRREAARRDWPILVFHKPVGLQSRSIPTRPALAVLVAGGAVAAAGIWWSSMRRRAGNA
jgi:HAD superfamily hydrolase (TIGR01490 family)